MDVLAIADRIASSGSGIEIMSHVKIQDNMLTVTNGKVSLEARVHDMPDMVVPAALLKKAISVKGDKSYSVGDHYVTVKSGKFRARLPISTAVFPERVEEIDEYTNHGDLLHAFAALRPFVAIDATRPWACAIRVADGYAYATNNIVVARYPISYTGENFNVPSYALDVLLQLDTYILKGVQKTAQALRFHFEGSLTLTSNFVDLEWPDMHKFFDRGTTDQAVPLALRDIVDTLLPFVPDAKFPIIIIKDRCVSTQQGTQSAEVDLAVNAAAAFHAKPLDQVLAAATHFDFSDYPKPCRWRGDKLEGVIAGVRTTELKED